MKLEIIGSVASGKTTLAKEISIRYQNSHLTNGMDEIEKINNWEHNPMAALPAWISIVAQK